MYYYIFDIKKCRKKSLVVDIKNYLSSLGISGEFSYPSTAYSTKELVNLGLSKKYNTIVGIGDDEIANEIAEALHGKTEAMGLIPIEATSDLEQLIGARSWKEACQNLRYRRISEIKVGKTANGKTFLTNVRLDFKKPTEVTLEFKDYIVKSLATNIMISNYKTEINKIGDDYLDIIMQSVGPEKSKIFKRISLFMGLNDRKEKSLSLFRARSLRIFTSSQIPIFSHNQLLAKTPQLIETSDENLRLIINRKGHND